MQHSAAQWWKFPAQRWVLPCPAAGYGVIEDYRMSKSSPGVHRRVVAFKRRAREWKMIAKGVASTDHPVLAHIIPIRRCNLSCTYCNEYDDFSKPVPVETMKRRVDELARL